MPIGKIKGGKFEREIAVELSKWISNGEREDLLWRSSMSGGRSTVARKKGKNLQTQAGDLSAIHPLGQPFIDKFYPELKSYEDLNYIGILTGTGHLVNFWKETVVQANHYNRHPMLIAKQNHRPVIVFMQVQGLRSIKLHIQQAVIASPTLGLYGFILGDFINKAKPPL